MNSKWKNYKEEYETISTLKSKHVTKKVHYELLVIALIFAMTGILIGYLTNQLNNLSYVTNMLFVTILGSFILYRYSTEKRFMYKYQLDYKIHVAVAPNLIKDITLIVGAHLTIVLTLLFKDLSLITIAFYALVFLILVICTIYSSRIKVINDVPLLLGHLTTFILYYLLVFYLTIKLLAIEEPWLILLVTGLLVFVFGYLRHLLQIKLNIDRFRDYIFLCIFFIGVFCFISYITIENASQRDDIPTVFSYRYDYNSLYSGPVFSIESNEERIMIVTYDFELIIYDQTYNELNRFDVSDFDASSFYLYEVADTFYLATSNSSANIYYDTYYSIDEEEGPMLITDDRFSLTSFTYNGYTIINSNHRANLVSEFGELVELTPFIERYPTFMIEDHHVLYGKETVYGFTYQYLSNEETDYSDLFYDDGYIFYSHYNIDEKVQVQLICEISEYIENGTNNCMEITVDEENNSPYALYNFQHKGNEFYITNRFTSEDDYVFRISRLNEKGVVESSYTLFDTNFDVLTGHFISLRNQEVLIAPIDSDIQMYSNSFENGYQTKAIIVLSLLCICGLPTGLIGERKTINYIKEKVTL